MASIRVTLTHEARRLAASDGGGESPGAVEVPPAAVARLQGMARTSGRPVRVLRWAWRSQVASYIDSRQFLDGLATIYLHAALLDAERREREVVAHQRT